MTISGETCALLIKKAKDDITAAKNLIAAEDFSAEIVLFHCQQAIEKALKAYLDSQDIIYPKVHDLEVLLSLGIKRDASFEQISKITALTPYAVEIRYGEVVEAGREEVADTIEETESALGFIFNKIT